MSEQELKSEIEKLKNIINENKEFIDEIYQRLINIKDYEASSDCACILENIAINYFGICTKYDCRDRGNCDGECNSGYGYDDLDDDDLDDNLND